MKISYKNDEIKSLCRKKYQGMSTEKILKRLENVLEFPIIILNCVIVYKFEYYERMVKVQNMNNNSIIEIII